MDEIIYDDFAKIDMRAGKVVNAEDVLESTKLIRLTVDFGDLGERIIFAGIKAWFKPEDLVGKLYPFVVNLKPKKMLNEESQGMLLALEDEKGCYLLSVPKKVKAGTKLH